MKPPTPADTPSALAPPWLSLVPGERLLFVGRPSPFTILLRPLALILVIIALAALLFWINSASRRILDPLWIFFPSAALLAALLLFALLQWSAYRLALTDRRVVVRSGFFSTLSSEIPLAEIRHVALRRSLPERLLNLGTIALSTLGSSFDVVWPRVAHPNHLLCLIRCAIANAHAPHPSALPNASATAPPFPRPVVIGLAGGIGAGKSSVALLFSNLGCLVIDSDALAKSALDRPDVRDALVSWWGEQILAPAHPASTSRLIDRAKVAAIIFSDPDQRRRLEELIHPIVRQDRAAMIAAAARYNHPAVVVDAPLLFEAGLDRECDAVVFVDAPRAERLARVQSTRGWDDAELARRESAQWPLETKRARATYILPNHAHLQDLPAAVENLLSRILASHRQPGAAPTHPPPAPGP